MKRGKFEKLCLCSSSESRALLLEKFGIVFEQKPVAYDEEQIKANLAHEFVYLASKGKMQAAVEMYGLEVPLLCADSVVAAEDGTILRKAKDREDARRILEIQSASEISIVSCLHYRTEKLLFIDTSTTYYKFAPFDAEDLKTYLENGEWQRKAGACMVEGFCKKYIKSVKGMESTAMGLQVEKLIPWIDKRV